MRHLRRRLRSDLHKSHTAFWQILTLILSDFEYGGKSGPVDELSGNTGFLRSFTQFCWKNCVFGVFKNCLIIWLKKNSGLILSCEGLWRKGTLQKFTCQHISIKQNGEI